MRPVLVRASLSLLAVATACLVAELATRMLGFFGRTQVVVRNHLTLLGDVPVWALAHDREGLDCVQVHPDWRRLLFVGSSITYGDNLRLEDTFGPPLQQSLNTAGTGHGFCVMNFAQSGFAFDQKFAVMRDAVAKYKPAAVFWEDWDSEFIRYRMIGDAAYGIRGQKIRADGFIGIPLIPDFLNRPLFLCSRLYQDLAFALDDGDPPNVREQFARERLSEVPRFVRENGARLVIYLATPLDRPLRDQPTEPQQKWQAPIIAMAKEQNVPVYSLAHELADEDFMAIRNDPCCHFNAQGHRALARTFERMIHEQHVGQ